MIWAVCMSCSYTVSIPIDEFQVTVNHLFGTHGLHHGEAFVHPRLQVLLAVAQGNDHQPETGQGILRAVFGDGDVERVAHLLLEAVGDTALSLEGVVAVQVVLDGKDCDDHDSIRW